MGLNYYSNFPNTNNPFFIRGGNYNNDTNAGVFYFNRNNGNNNSNNSFRVVVPVLRYRGKLKNIRKSFPPMRNMFTDILQEVSKKFNSIDLQKSKKYLAI